MNKYALLLVPEGEVFWVLKDLISSLAKQYNSPVFLPHVTLLADIIGEEAEVKDKASELALKLEPMVFEGGKLDSSNEYFKSVFILMNPNPEVLEANILARKVFNRESDPSFVTHLSLVYGDFPKTTKEKIIQEFDGKVDVSFKVESLSLYTGGLPVENWRLIQKYPFRA